MSIATTFQEHPLGIIDIFINICRVFLTRARCSGVLNLDRNTTV